MLRLGKVRDRFHKMRQWRGTWVGEFAYSQTCDLVLNQAKGTLGMGSDFIVLVQFGPSMLIHADEGVHSLLPCITSSCASG